MHQMWRLKRSLTQRFPEISDEIPAQDGKAHPQAFTSGSDLLPAWRTESGEPNSARRKK